MNRNIEKGQTFLSIEIGGTKLQLALGTSSGLIQRQQRLGVQSSLGARAIRQQIESAIPDFLGSDHPQAIAVGFGGPVDWRTGQITRSHQIEGWAGFDLRAWIHSVTNLPVLVENDANMAALGEAHLGSGSATNPVFYVTLGSGVGGGLVVDGHIYHGAVPGEAEIGHVRLDRQGTIVEEVCSGWAMDAQIQARKETHPDSVLSRLATSSPGSEARHLSTALQADDAAAWELLRDLAGNLAFGLSQVVHLLHPETIVLGGGLSMVGEPLRAAVAEALPGLVMEVFRANLRIRLAALGQAAVPTGGLVLAGQFRHT
jgi:glucokinase